MKGVIQKFFIASMLMWMTPTAILYGFNHNLLPGMAFVLNSSSILASFQSCFVDCILYNAVSGKLMPLHSSSNLSPHTLTLVSGFVAVISVNIVIAFYIYMAMKEPSHKHEPDPAFLAEAKASVNQSANDSDKSSQFLKKEE